MMIGFGRIGRIDQYANQTEIRQSLQREYGLSRPINNARMLWQFANGMGIGDVVVAVSGTRNILGVGIVQSDYRYQSSDVDDFNNIRPVSWTVLMDESVELQTETQFDNKTLVDITQHRDMIEQIDGLIDNEALDIDGVRSTADGGDLPVYTRDDFLREVYMDGRSYDRIVHALERKRNIILMGAPGVGKTFAAKRLAYSMIGEKDPNRVEMVQFHQNYSYEDFLIGYRPTETGFALKHGVFYEFCKKAESDDRTRPYFFIIDEINRGNLDKILGELFMLIENDKRGLEIQLSYGEEQFSIPSNVFVIGMMNTADRSLAMIDYALRRRFSFVTMIPGFDSEGFKSYEKGIGSARFDALVAAVRALNRDIVADESLGKGFQIGHSYLCGMNHDMADGSTLSDIVEYELIPLLEEYWFDDPDKVQDEASRLREAIR